MVSGVLLTLLMGMAAFAQLPPTIPPEPVPLKPARPGTGVGPGEASAVLDQLKKDLAGRLGDRKDVGDDRTSIQRAQLQNRLLMLIERLEVSREAPPATKTQTPPKTTTLNPPSESKSVNPIREGMNYFRDNDFDSARVVFNSINTGPLSREDRAFVQYMRACSLRRLNRVNEAAIIYREVADNNEDDFVTECAIWQLSLIRSAQELEAQLEQLRPRTKGR